ncbi:unnamed protein product [Clonostachys chloroleuca]|uniref:NADH:flavin oxidoreductase/NADH oxidase N-terminal domain-containing protein n=1 Tax=Clonostachys chloroleuca TaxID=1926264 RepID=A0AA35LR74_9HYPO|nr:unnamed protein product [Clonostachys chloroleuca]
MTATKVPADSKLLQPVKIGKAQLQHRIALAPLTRYRNDENHVVNSFAQRYYGERAATPGTLIISEATGVSLQDAGEPHGPAFATDEQQAAWTNVISAVHKNGSVWFQQLWSQGRASNPEYQKKRGYKYRSSSAVPISEGGVVPEAMTEEEIQGFIDDFVASAKRVIAAGGDGVEIHGAHGYLIDQFISDSVNKRTDKWGGSIENRSRLLFEVVKAVSAAIGPERTALRLSPFATFQGAESSDIIAQYTYIVRELKALAPLAYLSLVEPRGDPAKLLGASNDSEVAGQNLDFILEIWNNHSPVVVAGAYTPSSAASILDNHYAKWDVIVAFGRTFLATPDFVWRVKNGVAPNEYHRASFYIPASEVGYNDYPLSSEYIDARRNQVLKSLA